MADDEFDLVRKALAAVQPKAVDIADVAEKVDEALGQAQGLVIAAKTIPNDIEDVFRLLLAVHGGAGDVASLFKMAKAKIADAQSHWERIHAATRAALAKVLDSSGAGEIVGPTHKASTVKAKGKAVVTDIEALPLDCVQWVREADMGVISARLTLGQKVPGAKWVDGEAGVRIYSKGESK